MQICNKSCMCLMGHAEQKNRLLRAPCTLSVSFCSTDTRRPSRTALVDHRRHRDSCRRLDAERSVLDPRNLKQKKKMLILPDWQTCCCSTTTTTKNSLVLCPVVWGRSRPIPANGGPPSAILMTMEFVNYWCCYYHYGIISERCSTVLLHLTGSFQQL